MVFCALYLYTKIFDRMSSHQTEGRIPPCPSYPSSTQPFVFVEFVYTSAWRYLHLYITFFDPTQHIIPALGEHSTIFRSQAFATPHHCHLSPAFRTPRQLPSLKTFALPFSLRAVVGVDSRPLIISHRALLVPKTSQSPSACSFHLSVRRGFVSTFGR